MIEISPNPPSQVSSNGSKGKTLRTAIFKRAASLVSLRNVFFLLFVGASIALFWSPFMMLFDYSMRRGHQYDQYSFTLLIPLMAIALVYMERRKIFAKVQYGFVSGAILLTIGAVIGWYGSRAVGTVGPEESLSIAILGLVIFWMGGFVLCYGRFAGSAAKFELLFLLLTVPLPSALLTDPVGFVRSGSADFASFMFHILKVPVFRNGFIFALPGLTIEVAKECSGIHSILALFIISLLASHFSFLAGWKKVILALLVFPIVCLTNGLRITVLALLSAYVAPWIIHSSLHRDGGILFFLLGFFLLMLSLRFMKRSEVSVRASSGEEK